MKLMLLVVFKARFSQIAKCDAGCLDYRATAGGENDVFCQ